MSSIMSSVIDNLKVKIQYFMPKILYTAVLAWKYKHISKVFADI